MGALEIFIPLLEAEQQALQTGQVDNLPEISRNKSEQLLKLSQFGSNRDNMLRQAEIISERGELTRFLDSGPRSLRENWDKLVTLAKRAQELNQFNGALIAAMLKHNQQALAILHDAMRQNTLYGPDGHARSIGSGRELGKI